jgi:hypothetical protein
MFGSFVRYLPFVRVDALRAVLARARHMLALSLPRVAARHALTTSSAYSSLQCRRRAPPQRCGGVRCQIFPGDFAQQSELEADEAGDAARAVLRARRAVGAAVPPGERPSQEWCEGVLDGSGAPFWWREEAGGSGEVEVRLTDPALPSGDGAADDGAAAGGGGGASEEEAEEWTLGALPDGGEFWWRENECESDGVEISLVSPAELAAELAPDLVTEGE